MRLRLGAAWLVAVACVHPVASTGPHLSERAPLGIPRSALARAVPELFSDGLRIHVATDRPIYRPGDTIRIHSWSVTGATLAPTYDAALGPAGLRFDLVDPHGNVVGTAMAPDDEGLARTTLDLDRAAAGGAWTVRAIAHDGTVRERVVVVVPFEAPSLLGDVTFDGDGYGGGDRVTAKATLRRPTGEPLARAAVDVAVVVDGVQVERTSRETDADGALALAFDLPAGAVDAAVVVTDGAGGSVARPVPVAAGAPTIGVYPEGGRLVTGLPSRVYLSFSDAHGDPVDATGDLVDGQGRRVARISARRGRAVVGLTPAAGETYEVVLARPEPARAPVPAADARGCVLETRDDVDGAHEALRVTVRCSEPREVVVVAGIRGAWFDGARVVADPAGAVVDLIAEEAAIGRAQGVVQVTLLDAEAREPVAERLVYRNRGRDLDLTLAPSVAEALPGEAFDLRVEARDPDGHPVDALVALAAVDDGWVSTADEDLRDVRSALLLEPSVGEVDDPARFLDRSDPRSAEDLDRLLGTRGWRRFVRVPVAVAAPPPTPAPPAPEPAAPDGLTREFLQHVPAGRTYQVAVVAVPGANPNMGGGSINENTYLLDGGNVTDPISGFFVLSSTIDPWTPPDYTADDGVRVARSEVAPCFAREQGRTPDLGGTWSVSGQVRGMRARDLEVVGEVRNGPVEACIAHVLGDLAFRYGPERALFARIDTHRDPSATPAEYTVVRELPLPPAPGTVRSDLRPTIAWTTVRTGRTGSASVPITPSDAVTGFRIVAEAVAGGAAGRTERVLASRRPLSVSVRVPPQLVTGDEVELPVTVDNATPDARRVTLGAEIGEALDATLDTSVVDVPARSTVTVPLRVKAVAAGDVNVRLLVASDALADALDRTVRVAPRGFPRAVGATQRIEDGVVQVALDTRGALDGTLFSAVELAPGAAGAGPGMEGLLGEPHGCFEQTSATSYPNLLVLDWMDRVHLDDAAARARAEDLVDRGFARLLTFETRTGGFEWFGRAPGHLGLTAYGLRQFVRTAAVRDVDPKVIDRTARWLLDRRDGNGGYTASTGGLDTWASPDPVLAELYTTWALAEAGQGDALGRELARAASTRSDDPYLLALAALALRAAGRDAEPLQARLADRIARDGSFPDAVSTLTQSGDRDRIVETTALAALALPDSPARTDAIAWLAGARQPWGTWGSTQATVLALEALIADARATSTDTGPVRVATGGTPVGSLAVPAGLAPARLELPFDAGQRFIDVSGPEGLAVTVFASFRTGDLPPARGPLSLRTTVAAGPHRVGDLVRIEVEVVDTLGEGAAAPVARLGVPANLSLPAWAVTDLVADHGLAALEVGDGEIVVYWDTLPPGGRLSVPLDLTAELAGTATGEPSSAWPFYSPEKVWAAPITAAIAR